ncbi:hypothetical protein TNCV_4266511 [Trichonephila clavipes]|nr:hypothetical protein TNCV_4266511 [Trichonephila clavipes]
MIRNKKVMKTLKPENNFRAPDWENCSLCVALFSYLRAFGHCEQRPNDEDDT